MYSYIYDIRDIWLVDPPPNKIVICLTFWTIFRLAHLSPQHELQCTKWKQWRPNTIGYLTYLWKYLLLSLKEFTLSFPFLWVTSIKSLFPSVDNVKYLYLQIVSPSRQVNVFYTPSLSEPVSGAYQVVLMAQTLV